MADQLAVVLNVHAALELQPNLAAVSTLQAWTHVTGLRQETGLSAGGQLGRTANVAGSVLAPHTRTATRSPGSGTYRPDVSAA